MMANLHLPESPVCVPDGVEESLVAVESLFSDLLVHQGKEVRVLPIEGKNNKNVVQQDSVADPVPPI